MVLQANEGLLSNFLKKRRFSVAIKYCKEFTLDYGCGDGSFSNYFLVQNYNGYDSDFESLEFAKQSYPKYTFIEKIDLNKKYDTIVLLAVIEHLNNPVEFLKEISNSLLQNKNSRIVLTTPNKYFDSIHHIGARLGLFSTHAAEEHNIMFNKRDLFDLARKTNLKVVTFKRFLFFVNQLIVLTKND